MMIIYTIIQQQLFINPKYLLNKKPRTLNRSGTLKKI